MEIWASPQYMGSQLDIYILILRYGTPARGGWAGSHLHGSFFCCFNSLQHNFWEGDVTKRFSVKNVKKIDN